MFRTLMFSAVAVFGFHLPDAAHHLVEPNLSIQTFTTSGMPDKDIESFSCQDCHEFPSEAGPYEHFFHPAMFAAALSIPMDVGASYLGEPTPTPFAEGLNQEFDQPAVFAQGFAATVYDDDGLTTQ